MKKIITGGLIVFSFLVGLKVFAEVQKKWYVTDRLEIGGFSVIVKTFDENTNVVCYAFKAGYAGGISCLKNI